MSELPFKGLKIDVENGYLPLWNKSDGYKAVKYTYTVSEDGTAVARYPKLKVSGANVFSNGNEYSLTGSAKYTSAVLLNARGESLSISITDEAVTAYNTVTAEAETLCKGGEHFILEIGTSMTYSPQYEIYTSSVAITSQNGDTAVAVYRNTFGFDAEFTSYSNQKYKVTEVKNS